MDNLLSKVFSFLNAAFEPREEVPTKRVDFFCEPESEEPPPGAIVENRESYPLVDFANPDGPGFVLNFSSKNISGPLEYGWSDIEKVLYLPHESENGPREMLALKIRLGPLLCFEDFESEASAVAHMERFVSRLFRQDGVCRSYLDQRKADPFPALKQRSLKGRFAASLVRFESQRVIFPLMVIFEEPKRYYAEAALVFCRESGIHLYDGLGRKEKIGELNEVSDLSMEESVRFGSECETELIHLTILFKSSYKMEVEFMAHRIHDDRIPGEEEKSEADMNLGRGVFRRLRQFLGFKA